MGPDIAHPSAVASLSIIFEKLWRSGDIPENWNAGNPTYKRGLKEDLQAL